MGDLPGALQRLTERLETLERRVALLEHPATILNAPVAQTPAITSTADTEEGLSLAQAGGVFSVLGKAMLGIAGAYLLRAVAESASLPRFMIAAIAILYALSWLVASVRLPIEAWFASTVYAGTSALILAPMLWELTLRFNVMPAPAAAAILCVFAIAATALAWKRDRAPVLWVANIAAACSALALIIATHDLTPFIATLLLLALICEGAAWRNHQMALRPLVAVAVDFAVWALIYVYSGPQSARMDYPVIGIAGLLLPGSILFLIYGVNALLRTTLLRQRISVFETTQTMIAFLLAAVSLLYFEPQKGQVLLGIMCLLFSIGCYAAAFALFDKVADHRNYNVFAAWAASLLVAGSFLCLPPFWLALTLSLAAIAATVSTSRLTLKFHGLVFLGSAAVASRLLEYAFNSLAGSLPARPGASLWPVSACALVCYAAGKRNPQENWQRQLLHLIPAALAAFALVALLVEGLSGLFALRAAPEAHHVAFIRTLILCLLSLALAFAGSRLRRTELTRMAYATLAVVTVKLLFEDLRLGHMEFIAAAIFLFAITLIAVPRLVRIGQKSSEISHPSAKPEAT